MLILQARCCTLRSRRVDQKFNNVCHSSNLRVALGERRHAQWTMLITLRQVDD